MFDFLEHNPSSLLKISSQLACYGPIFTIVNCTYNILFNKYIGSPKDSDTKYTKDVYHFVRALAQISFNLYACFIPIIIESCLPSNNLGVMIRFSTPIIILFNLYAMKRNSFARRCFNVVQNKIKEVIE
jgi:hypothetical protein